MNLSNNRPGASPGVTLFHTQIEGLLSDDDLDELIEVDPFNREPSNRNSDAKIERLFSIMDELKNSTGKDGK